MCVCPCVCFPSVLYSDVAGDSKPKDWSPSHLIPTTSILNLSGKAKINRMLSVIVEIGCRLKSGVYSTGLYSIWRVLKWVLTLTYTQCSEWPLMMHREEILLHKLSLFFIGSPFFLYSCSKSRIYTAFLGSWRQGVGIWCHALHSEESSV